MSTYRISGLTDLKLLRNNSGTVQELDVYFINSVEFSPETEDIEWRGDGQVLTVSVETGLTVEMEADAWDADTVAAMFGVTAVTVGLPSGEAKRWNFGTDTHGAGVPAGLRAVATATDVDTGTAKTIEIRVHKGTLSMIPPPTGLASRSAAQMTFRLAAERTLTDIAGIALPGVSGSGIFWSLAEMT